MLKKVKREKSIRKKMISMALLPILVLSLFIISIGMILLYRLYTQSIRNELTATTNVVLDCLNLTVRGDYSYESGMLLKGNLNITDSTMLYRVQEEAQIDVSIFWQDVRILSTVSNKYGVSAVGTRADREVAEAVLEKGECYYSTHLDINGASYIGYYMPMKNSDGSIVGMIFAGKKKGIVYQGIKEVMLWFLGFSVAASVLALILSSVYSNRMISDINVINKFLEKISEGDLTVSLDQRITSRKDELGRIGEYASGMRRDLKKLIERDPLTALYNRRSCNNKLKALEEAHSEYVIVMCDIDWFKKINDTYGHDAGDYILVTLSKLIVENVRDCGFASRWGGEEFLLVYQSDHETAIQKVRQIQQSIREHEFYYEGNTLRVTMTFGVGAKDSAATYEQRISMADESLYVGKNNGRNQIVDGETVIDSGFAQDEARKGEK